MAYDVLALVTDRTAEDVERARRLWVTKWEQMTPSEQAEWNAGLKGGYNAKDLNRVEEAVAALSEDLRDLPNELKAYAQSRGVAWDEAFNVSYNPDLYVFETKTDWKELKIPTAQVSPTEGDMIRYLRNVERIKTALTGDYPTLPISMSRLTFAGANAIEETLVLVDAAIIAERETKKNMIDAAAAAWIFAGTVESGFIWSQIGG